MAKFILECPRSPGGMPKRDKVVEWYKEAAKKDGAYGEYCLGKYYEIVEKNYCEAAKWYKKAASYDAYGLYNLGKSYELERGVEQNHEEAVRWFTRALEWFKKAAEGDNSLAKITLRECYEKGYGVEQDLELAFRYYKEAAEQEEVDAQCHLGECYEEEMGIEKSNENAMDWYRKATEQGNLEAQKRLRSIQNNIYH